MLLALALIVLGVAQKQRWRYWMCGLTALVVQSVAGTLFRPDIGVAYHWLARHISVGALGMFGVMGGICFGWFVPIMCVLAGYRPPPEGDAPVEERQPSS